jgi:hypothetical protein
MARKPQADEKVNETQPAETQPETTATETAIEAQAAETEVDLTAFNGAVEAAIEAADETTGTVAAAQLSPVQAQYRALDGAKAKNKAKKHLSDTMTTAITSQPPNIKAARALMFLSDNLTVAGSSATPKAPADPKAAYIEQVQALGLAVETLPVPEGVEVTREELAISDEQREQLVAYRDWLNREPAAEGAEDLPEPQVSAVVKAAIKLQTGKAVRRTSGGSTRSDGPRRDIGKHILNAFADKEPGTFLTVAEIRGIPSEEYPATEPPSQGAISARLFPASGKCSLVDKGVKPASQNKNGKEVKGAVKTAA